MDRRGAQREENCDGGSECPVHDLSSCGEVYSRTPRFAKSRPGEIGAEHGILPEELHDLIRSDFERWNRIVREANIKAD
jgi:hypothetical protein